MIHRAIVICLCCVACSAAIAQSSPASQTLKLTETVIAELSPGAELASARMAKERLAWIEKQNGKRVVRLDGKQQGGSYEEARYLHFNPDATKLGFAAKRNGKWVLIIDGK